MFRLPASVQVSEKIIMPRNKKNVLLLSLPMYGHMIPLLEFGKKLSKYHHVTFAVSSIKVNELLQRQLFVEHPDNDLRLVGIDDGYRPEWDDFVPGKQLTIFQDLFSCITPPTAKFVESRVTSSITPPVDVAIADNFFGAPLAICHERSIPFYLFNTANAVFTLELLMVNENDVVIQRPEECDTFMRRPRPGSLGQPIPAFFKNRMLENNTSLPLAHGLIVNSFRAIDEEALKVLADHWAMKDLLISCIGPLIPEEKEEKAANRDLADNVRKWLDGKTKGSVVYISFGSIAIPAPEQLKELGQSLLLLNKPFILSLRTEFHVHLPSEINEGIEKQSGKFLVLPWSPQKVILMHPATRIFLSHCGWNSVLEGIFGGVPIVGWPMFADQLMNAEWVDEHGLGRIIRGTGVRPERVVPAEAIRDTIADVAGWGDGCEIVTTFTTTARRWKGEINTALGPDGSSQREFKELVMFEHKRDPSLH